MLKHARCHEGIPHGANWVFIPPASAAVLKHAHEGLIRVLAIRASSLRKLLVALQLYRVLASFLLY